MLQKSDKVYFINAASEFVYTRTYSRWRDQDNRRETWEESVDRYIEFLIAERGNLIPAKVIKKIRKYMLSFGVMPSMRALWSAGDAARQENLCMYNCSARAVDSLEAFAEALYILCCGTGFGFSVEARFVEQLPLIPHIDYNKKETFIVPDSKEGWADSIKAIFNNALNGVDTEFNYSLIRPKGARLKTMGGRASGPEPLIKLHSFLKDALSKAQGKKLTPMECHDIMCEIAEIVVVGGVRRSSLISLSDLFDSEIANCKNFPFPPRRYMANNSAIYYSKPTAVEFLKEWGILAASGSGERGIINMETMRNRSPKRRNKYLICMTNPCSEIALRNKGLCNLSEVVVRQDDDVDTLLDKVETATWIGAIQSTFTKFNYVSKEWITNAEEERLLGTSLTGQMDNPEVLPDSVLAALRKKAIKTAKHASEKLGIPMPAAITCVKPSGTVSQLVDSSSGLHTRYSKYYIRRYRISTMDPLYKMLRDQKVPMNPEVDQVEETANTFVLDFPVKAPENCITRNHMNAIEQLEWYKKIMLNWCEHNASITVYVKDDEWFQVGNWVYSNWDLVSGVSFLPHDSGKYKLAPYEEIDEAKYNKLVEEFPKIDYSELSKYENEDNTTGAQSLACAAGICELP